MKKGQIYESVIETVDFPDRGICHEENIKISIKRTLPGQKVRYSIKKKRNGKAEGRLLEVVEKSPFETAENVCRHFGICGGCIYQSVPYEQQLAWKEDQIRRLFRDVFEKYGQEFVLDGIRPSPVPAGYRNKMEYTFGDACKGGELELGMHQQGSFYDIVTVDDCRITDPDFTTILSAVLEFFRSRQIPYYHRMRHEGYLRHLLVRKAAFTGEIIVDLVTSSRFGTGEDETVSWETASNGPAPDAEGAMLKQFSDILRNLKLDGKLTGILHTYNDSLADVVQNDRTDVLYGRDYIIEKLLGLSFKITPFSFFQTNSRGAQVLYSIVRDYIGQIDGASVFDLYSGTGTIAQVLAPAAGKVTGVEIVEEAVEAARENAALNGLDNCTFLAGDVLKVIDEIEDKPDILVLDPPRDGIHPKAMPKLLAYDVESIVYISCKPTSLVRDLEAFFAHGYKVEKMCCVDMFPGTGNVETVCLLSKLSGAKNHISVKVEMDLTAAESKATYQEIQDWVQEKYGFHVTHLNIAKTKRKCGIIERQNFNLPKSDDSRSPETQKDKEEAIIEAFRHFQMI